jgi:hypothetical protein
VTRTLLTALTLFGTALPLAAVAAPPVVLSADEALDLPLVITSLSKTQSAVSSRDVADAVVRVLAAEHPGATPRRVVDGAVDACRLDVSCLTDTRAMQPPPPRAASGLLIVIETNPSSATLTLAARVYDADAIALKRSHGESQESIQASTLLCEGPDTLVSDVGLVDDAARTSLAPCHAILRARVAPRARASLVLRGIPPNGIVAIDGRTLGLVASSSVVHVSLVRPGTRELEVRAERYAPYQASIDVVAPETTVAVRLERERRRPIMLIAGAVAVAAGTTALIAAAGADSDFVRVCPGGSCPVPDGDWVQSGGVDPVSGPSGFPVAPVGISAIAAGLVWGVSDLVFAEEGLPVFTILAGLAAAGVGAAVSAGAN